MNNNSLQASRLTFSAQPTAHQSALRIRLSPSFLSPILDSDS